MSNYPPTPSYGGPSSYVQQWPPPPPPASTSSLPPLPPNFAMSNAGRMHDFNAPGSFNTESHLPGLGMPGASIPPPFFVNQLPNNNFSAPFYPAPMNPLGYQPISSQPAHVSSQPGVASTQAGAPASVQTQTNHALGNLPNTQKASSDELDREEGEVSEKNGESFSGRQYNGQNSSRSPVPHIADQEGTHGADSTSKDLNGLEAGRDSSSFQLHETSRRHSTGMADAGSSSATPQSRRDASESRMDLKVIKTSRIYANICQLITLPCPSMSTIWTIMSEGHLTKQVSRRQSLSPILSIAKTEDLHTLLERHLLKCVSSLRGLC